MQNKLASAVWEHPAAVEAKYSLTDLLARLKSKIWLGRSRGVPIGHADDRHIALVSGTRGGKGASVIIPTLTQWRGSAVVIDPKGENATVTAARRGPGSKHCQGMGQAVYVLDPFEAARNLDPSLRAHFNPLDVLQGDEKSSFDKAYRIADAIVVVREDSKNPFFDETARVMVLALILHVVSAPEYEGRRNLVTVRQLLLAGDQELVAALKENGETDIPSGRKLLWAAMTRSTAFEGKVSRLAENLLEMATSSPKEFTDVVSTATVNTDWIDSPGMTETLEYSDFAVSDLKTRREGMTVYLSLPLGYLSTHFRWLRMMIALTITEMEKIPGGPASGAPVLMVLDEFLLLKRMPVIENAMAYMASYGVRMLFAVQSLAAMKDIYKDNWETLLGNAGTKIFFNIEDHFTREYASKLIGETEIMRVTQSSSGTYGINNSVALGTNNSLAYGVNRSVTEGESWTESTGWTKGTSSGLSGGSSHTEGSGTSSSWGSSFGTGVTETYGPTGILNLFGPRHTGSSTSSNSSSSSQYGTSTNVSDTTNSGWNLGTNEGTSGSRGTGGSLSEAMGLNIGLTTGSNETRTSGSNASATVGSNETYHRRPLIYPDEIGLTFGRIDDDDDALYPGLALVLLAGKRPMVVQRVNYFEDPMFRRCFDPHPDHPRARVKFRPSHPYPDREIGIAKIQAFLEPAPVLLPAPPPPPPAKQSARLKKFKQTHPYGKKKRTGWMKGFFGE